MNKPQQKQAAKPLSSQRAIEKHKAPQGNIAEIPEYLRRAPGQGAAGFDEVEQGDLTLPRLALCQALTPQRDETEAKYIEGLEEGHYFNTLTGENYAHLLPRQERRRRDTVPLR